MFTNGCLCAGVWVTSGVGVSDGAGVKDAVGERVGEGAAPAVRVMRLKATAAVPVAAASRASFGLRDQGNLYVCLQNPMKFHSDFDPLLKGILEADPNGTIVLLAVPDSAFLSLGA